MNPYVVVANANAIQKEDFVNSVNAIILPFDSFSEGGLTRAEAWLGLMKTWWDAEIKILVCDKCAPETNSSTSTATTVQHLEVELEPESVTPSRKPCISKPEAQTWCVKNGFELVELDPTHENSSVGVENLSESNGMKRVVQALQSQMRSRPKKINSKGNEDPLRSPVASCKNHSGHRKRADVFITGNVPRSNSVDDEEDDDSDSDPMPAIEPTPRPSTRKTYLRASASPKNKKRKVDNPNPVLKGKSHKSKPEIECSRCGKKFKTSGGLKIHFAAHVRDDKKFVCKTCDKKFRKQESLDMHEKTDHAGYKPHACPQCGRSFRLKDKLKLHIMIIHEGRKPFPCPKCEKSFRTKYHLKIHDVSQHIQGGDSIGCSQCKRKFADRDALEKHVVTHQLEKPFVCMTCSKGFQTAARLKLHEKSHQAISTCLCPICGRTYKHERDLKLHEVVHQDESTYRFGCGDCPRRFYRIDLLRVHQSNEQHFSPEVIGPTISTMTKSEKLERNQRPHNEIDDNDEHSNDTTIFGLSSQSFDSYDDGNNDRVSGQTAHRTKFEEIDPRSRVVRFQAMGHHPPSGLMEYVTKQNQNQNQPTVIQVQIDPSVMISSSGGKSSDFIGVPHSHTSHTPMTYQRIQGHALHHDPQPSGSGFFITQRERGSIHTHHGLQIQSIPSSTHPHIQFGNQTIYTNSIPINIANTASASEQIGLDILSSFINNLGPG